MCIQEDSHQMAANLLVVLTAVLPTCATSLLCYSVAQQLDLSVSCCIMLYQVYSLRTGRMADLFITITPTRI